MVVKSKLTGLAENGKGKRGEEGRGGREGEGTTPGWETHKGNERDTWRDSFHCFSHPCER
jgi:hypothetical protein